MAQAEHKCVTERDIADALRKITDTKSLVERARLLCDQSAQEGHDDSKCLMQGHYDAQLSKALWAVEEWLKQFSFNVQWDTLPGRHEMPRPLAQAFAETLEAAGLGRPDETVRPEVRESLKAEDET